MTMNREAERRMAADAAREAWEDYLGECEMESELAEENRWRHALATRAGDPVEPLPEYGFAPPWAVSSDG